MSIIIPLIILKSSDIPSRGLLYYMPVATAPYTYPGDYVFEADEPVGGYVLPDTLFADIGAGPFFDEFGEPIIVTIRQVEDLEGVNEELGVFCSREKGVAWYDAAVLTPGLINRIRRWFGYAAL